MVIAALSPSPIRSLEDLSRARQEALDRRQAAQEFCLIQVSTATCGVASGALDTLKAIRQYAQEIGLTGIFIQETGCLGLCALEPVVRVHLPGRPWIMYCEVTPTIARQILDEHVLRGRIVEDNLIQA